MAYTDDWESLMNGVFGAGGKLKFGGAQPQPEKPQPEKPAGSGLPDLNAALLEQQKQLDELLRQQNARLKAQDAGVQTALEDSRRMLRDMEADGLLAKGTADTKPEQLGSFEGLAAEVKKTVLGQDAFVDSVVRAMRRPFVLGTEGAAARNVILLWGAPGTGRHFALAETARIMAARGLLQSDRMAVMDLALYPDPGAEKLFLQDLYAALHAPGEIVVFEHYESCHPGFLRILSDLAVKGSAPLSSRYLVNKEGILVEAGTALAPGAVSRIDPCGKYLIFFSRKGREALADKFGASFVAAVGDVCQTAPFTPEALAALAAQQLNALAQRVHSRLGLTLAAGAEVRDYVAAQCSKEKGAEGLADCCERIFRALSEYCLQTDAKLSGTVALTAAPEGLQFALNGAAPADLFSLLPAAYTGAVEQIRADIANQQEEATAKVNELLAHLEERREQTKRETDELIDQARSVREEADAYAASRREEADGQATEILRKANEEADGQVEDRRRAAQAELDGMQARIVEMQAQESTIAQRVSELRALFSNAFSGFDGKAEAPDVPVVNAVADLPARGEAASDAIDEAPHPIDQDSETSVLEAVAGEPDDTVAITSVSSVSSDSDAPEPDDGTVVMPAVRNEERSGDADEDDMPTVGIPVGDGGTDSEDQPSGE